MSKLLISFLAFIGATSQISSVIVFSAHTPSGIRSGLPQAISNLSTNPLEIEFLEYSATVLTYIAETPFQIVFDYTYSLTSHLELERLTSSNRLILAASFKYPYEKVLKNWKFYLHPNSTEESKAVTAVADALKWDTYHIISDQSSDSKEAASFAYDKIRELDPDKIQHVVLANDSPQKLYDRYIAKSIKPTGNWKIIAFNRADAAAKCVTAMKHSRIYRDGGGILMSARAAWGRYDLGSVVVVEEGLEGANSEGEYEALSIVKFLNIVLGVSSRRIDTGRLIEGLQKLMNDQRMAPNYKIMNYKSDDLMIEEVGTVSMGEARINDMILYPGNVTSISETKIIPFSANTGLVNYNGEIDIMTFSIFLGLHSIIYIINNDPTILTNFKLQVHEVDCGALVFDYDYFSVCLERHYSSLGLFYVHSIYAKVTEGTIGIMRSKEIELIHMGEYYGSTEPYDKGLYPELILSTPNTLMFYITYPYIIRGLGWNNVVVFYVQGMSPEIIDGFTYTANELGLNILNDEKYRYIPYEYTMDDFEEYEEYFKHAYDTGAKIILYFIVFPADFYITQSLYRVGFRKNDVVIIFLNRIFSLINEDLPGVNKNEFLELAGGSLQISFPEYIGDYGTELKGIIEQMVYPYPVDLSCPAIDAILLAVHGIDKMITLGLEYEDPEILNEFLRATRITGCSGSFSIDGQENGKNGYVLMFSNLYYDEDLGDYVSPVVGTYSLWVSVPFQLTQQIIWPDGSTDTPTDIRETGTLCGFERSQLGLNNLSKGLSLVITGILLLWVITSGLIFNRAFPKNLDMLTKRTELVFEDGIALLIVVIEGLQYMALGPDYSDINIVIYYLSRVVSFDIERIVNFEFRVFWVGLNVVLAISLIWSICYIIISLKIDKKLPSLISDLVYVIGEVMYPVIGNAFFVGILLILLKIYQCDEGLSEDITDTVLANDCTTFCWTGVQYYYAIYTGIVLLIYTPLAIISRPLSEPLMTHTHIRTLPLYSILKSCFQVILVTSSYHLKSYFPDLYSVLFLLYFVCWSVVVVKIVPYNYARLNLWARLIVFGIVWHTVLITFSLYFSFINSLVYLLIQLSGWIALGVAGLVLQKKYFPSLFYRKGAKDIAKYFRFQLTSQVTAEEIMTYNKNHDQPENSSDILHDKVKVKPEELFTFRTK